MSKIAWITDSTCSLPESVRTKHHIYILPSRIQFGEMSYRDGIDLTEDAFYAQLKEAKELPTTSQPSIGETVELFQTLKEEYEFAVAVHLSSTLSGTLNATKQAAEIADFRLYAVDSRVLSLPMFEIIQKGIALFEEGKTPEEVVDVLRVMHERAHIYVLVGALDQLHKGGRLNNMQLLLGSLLQIKPIIRVKDGKLEAFDKVRSRKKALQQLVGYFEASYQANPHIENVTIIHALAGDDATWLTEQIRAVAPHIQVEIGSLGSAMGVHGGEKTIGICWYD